MTSYIPPGIYSFKGSNGNPRTMCEMCSKLTIKTPERFGILVFETSTVLVFFDALNGRL